jgi:site-specific recombinase XerD
MTKADLARRKTLKLSLRATKLGIRVRRVKNRNFGEVYGHSWQVEIPSKVTGGDRIRKQFTANESRKAVDFAEGEAGRVKEQGTTAFYLTPEQVTDARKSLERLEGLGMTLLEAADYAARHLRPEGGDKTLGEVRDAIIAAKKKKGLRPASFNGLDFYFAKLVNHFGEGTLVKTVSAVQLSALVDSFSANGASPRHVRNLCTYAGQFFRFAEQERFIARNPAALLGKDAPMSDEREIAILTIPEVKRLLVATMLKEHRDLLPAVTLGLFCGGIRTEELIRLKWPDVDLEGRKVRLKGEQTKTREKRTCEIPPGAVEFLLLHPNRRGAITPAKFFKRRLTALYRAAGFKNWQKTHANAKRHSFGTYASKLHDWEWVVTQMGNSVAMLLKHYRDASVTPEAAKEYFSLTPATVGTAAEIEDMPAEKGA